jgi:hypothetical protein
MAHMMKLICLMFVVIVLVANNRAVAESSEMEDDDDSGESEFGLREALGMDVDKRMIDSCSI